MKHVPTYILSSWAAVMFFLPSVWGAVLPCPTGVFTPPGHHPWLVGLAARGTVWGITGTLAPAAGSLLHRMALERAVSEPASCPSADRTLSFWTRSATAICIARLNAVACHWLLVPVDTGRAGFWETVLPDSAGTLAPRFTTLFVF